MTATVRRPADLPTRRDRAPQGADKRVPEAALPQGLPRAHICAVHWKDYVNGLHEARGAWKPAAPNATKVTGMKAATRRGRRRTPMAHLPEEEARKVPSRTNRLAARNRAKPSPKVAEAEALIAEVDALPGPDHVKRVGDDDVQAALETLANGGTAETPVGKAIDGGTEEADAA